MKTVLLDASKHDRQHFDCGVDALNNCLKLMANQQAKRDNVEQILRLINRRFFYKKK